MAITSTIVNDSVAKTSTLTVLSGITSIESCVYTQSTNNLVFSTINPFNLSIQDDILFESFLITYQNNLINGFSISNVSVPFSISQVQETNDGVNSITFKFYQANHPLYNITATYPAGTVNFGNRNQATTLTYQEWLYMLQSKHHFYEQLRLYYKV